MAVYYYLGAILFEKGVHRLSVNVHDFVGFVDHRRFAVGAHSCSYVLALGEWFSQKLRLPVRVSYLCAKSLVVDIVGTEDVTVQ